MKLITDIYRSNKKEGAYLYIKSGASLESLPQNLLATLGKLDLSMTILITPDKKLANADAVKVIDSIEDQGFYLQLPPQPEAYMQTIANAKMPSAKS